MGTVTIICGASGSGKSTLGQALASRLGVPFVEGDEYHPPVNIDKMTAGIALDDRDRLPWLQALAQACYAPCVVSCSALNKHYRDVLRQQIAFQPVRFILLHADAELLAQRLEHREGHFMKRVMLVSQLNTLELPKDENDVTVLDASLALEQLIVMALQ